MKKAATVATQLPALVETGADWTAEIERRKSFLAALMAITGVSKDQVASRVAHAARGRLMMEFAANAQRKVSGVLDGSLKLAAREWKLLVELLAAGCVAALNVELSAASPEPKGLGVFNREEKQLKERRSMLLSRCVDLSGLTLGELAQRVARMSNGFRDAAEAKAAITAVIEKRARLTSWYWSALLKVFVSAAFQGIAEEQRQVAGEVLEPDAIPRMEEDAMLAQACLLISGMAMDQAARNIAYLGRTFGVESLQNGIEEKLGDVLAARCLMTDIERSCVLRVLLKPATESLSAELIPGRQSAASPARFSDLLRGCLKLSDHGLEDAAPIVTRAAQRQFSGRLETEARNLLARSLEDPEAISFSSEERSIIAHALFSVPLRRLHSELELCR